MNSEERFRSLLSANLNREIEKKKREIESLRNEVIPFFTDPDKINESCEQLIQMINKFIENHVDDKNFPMESLKKLNNILKAIMNENNPNQKKEAMKILSEEFYAKMFDERVDFDKVLNYNLSE